MSVASWAFVPFFLRPRPRWLAAIVMTAALAVPQPAEAVVDRTITFASTPEGRTLNHGDPIVGTEWLTLGVRFTGRNLHIVNDATCSFCLFGEAIVATFVVNGLPAVTGELYINYVNSPGAFTTVGDINGQVLLQRPGDIGPPNDLMAPNIAIVLIRTVGNGFNAFGFDIPGPPTSLPPGSSQDNPLLPSEPALTPEGFFTFLNAFMGRWIDPPVAFGYEYEMLSDSEFTTILGFPSGFDDPFTVSVDAGPLPGSFGPGDSVSLPAGTKRFTITGISPPADPDRPDAFPVQLVFDTALASFTMRPLLLPNPDTVPPTTAASTTPEPNENGWNNSDVIVGFEAHDDADGTGVAQISVSLDGAQSGITTVDGSSAGVTIAAEGTTVAAYFATDNAGNQEPSKTLVVRIDKTPPVVTFTSQAASYTVAQTITITCSASDAHSGIASDTCPIASLTGVPAYSLGGGSHIRSASAVDFAGNIGDGSIGFSVVVTPSSLCLLTNQFVQSSSTYQALTSRQRAAVDKLSDALCSKLATIVPKLTPAQKANLVVAYTKGVAALAAAGWLTEGQATILANFATAL